MDSNSSKTQKKALLLIDRVLSTAMIDSKNPESITFFFSDTYRFYFLMSFMLEYFNENEISQEYAISLVPKKFASRIKRLQVLKQAVQLGFIEEETSKLDRRRRIYKPSEQMVSDFYAYADNAIKDL